MNLNDQRSRDERGCALQERRGPRNIIRLAACNTLESLQAQPLICAAQLSPACSDRRVTATTQSLAL
jgi:hypothetical protein